MRRITKKNSTKAEREFYEMLKFLKIPFKHRWLVKEKEVDFIVGKYAVEINGHPQNIQKNKFLVENGYIPVHFSNKAIREQKEETIKKLLKLI